MKEFYFEIRKIDRNVENKTIETERTFCSAFSYGIIIWCRKTGSKRKDSLQSLTGFRLPNCSGGKRRIQELSVALFKIERSTIYRVLFVA